MKTIYDYLYMLVENEVINNNNSVAFKIKDIPFLVKNIDKNKKIEVNEIHKNSEDEVYVNCFNPNKSFDDTNIELYFKHDSQDARVIVSYRLQGKKEFIPVSSFYNNGKIINGKEEVPNKDNEFPITIYNLKIKRFNLV